MESANPTEGSNNVTIDRTTVSGVLMGGNGNSNSNNNNNNNTTHVCLIICIFYFLLFFIIFEFVIGKNS